MNSIRRHCIKYPSARTTTIAYLEARDRKTAQLRAEIEQFRSKRPWWREALQNLKAAVREVM